MSESDVSQSLDSSEGEGTPRVSQPVLIACFIGAFATACLVSLIVGHYTIKAPRRLNPFASNASISSESFNSVEKLFVVSTAGSYRKVVAGERLNPIPGQDYALFIWLRLRRIPAPGEVFSVVSKFDPHVAYKPGYAISLEGAPDGVRPRVYVSAASGGGRWYSFAAHPMSRRNWYLLTMALSEDTYVSTYMAQQGTDQPPAFLGAYKMRLASLPFSASDLTVGALGQSRFRGHIGPFGVLSGEGLQRDLMGYLGKMQGNPAIQPRQLPRGAVLMWATPTKDVGPVGYSIVEELKTDPNVSAPTPKTRKRAATSKAAGKYKLTKNDDRDKSRVRKKLR